MKKILFAGAEVMPFGATGGLGDVLGSLPAAIKKELGEDADVRVVMPLYSAVKPIWREQMTDAAIFTVRLSWRCQYCGVKKLMKDGVTFYFIDNEYYFDREKLYGYEDDGERFAYFSKAILDMMPEIDFYPDVLHLNDWQTALTATYLHRVYKDNEAYSNIKTVFTIHNIEYQGVFPHGIEGDVFGLDERVGGTLDYNGSVNLMKSAIECADAVGTVSPTYAEEILHGGKSSGLYYALADNAHKLSGILNGIDYSYYDPSNDGCIARSYTWRSATRKSENRVSLQRELGLPERDVPMLSVISRLASHKGLDLVRDIAYDLLKERDVQFVLLGTGEAELENFFKGLEEAYPDKCRALIKYDRDLSKRIYAASDIFLMPSKSEPCGLSQMIASRYGAIPVVRETGGLYDSIKPYYEADGVIYGNGFTFADYAPAVLRGRVDAALELWADPDKRKKFVSKIMRTDFSWGASAKKYIEMYENL